MSIAENNITLLARELERSRDTATIKAKMKSHYKPCSLGASIVGVRKRWTELFGTPNTDVPPYVSSLKLTSEEIAFQQSTESKNLVSKLSNSWTLDSIPIMLQIQKAMSDPQSCNPFKLACYIAIVTGRRMTEIFKTIELHPVSTSNYHATIKGRLKLKCKNNDLAEVKIPILAKYTDVKRALNVLREAKPCSNLTINECNAKYSNSVNCYAKKILGNNRKFHDFRTIYALITFEICKPHSFAQPLWISKCLGHCSLASQSHYSALHLENTNKIQKIKNPYS